MVIAFSENNVKISLMNDGDKISKNGEFSDEGEEITVEEETVSPMEALKKIKGKLMACEKDKMEYLSGWQRAKADMVNARREMDDEKARLAKFSEKSLVVEFLELADSFDRLFKNKESLEKIDKNWRQGIENLRSQLVGILKTRGVEGIECSGKKFDPKEHESIGEVDVDEKEKDGIVMEEMRSGYKMHGVIIRPSLVRLGKFKE